MVPEGLLEVVGALEFLVAVVAELLFEGDFALLLLLLLVVGGGLLGFVVDVLEWGQL